MLAIELGGGPGQQLVNLVRTLAIATLIRRNLRQARGAPTGWKAIEAGRKPMDLEHPQPGTGRWWQTHALLLGVAVLAVIGMSVGAAAALDTAGGEASHDSLASGRQAGEIQLSLPPLPSASAASAPALPSLQPRPSRSHFDCLAVEAKVKAALKEHNLGRMAHAKVSCTTDSLSVTVAVVSEPLKVNVVVDVRGRGAAKICANGTCTEYPNNGQVFTRDGHVVIGLAGGATVNVWADADLSSLPIQVETLVSAQTLQGAAVKVGTSIG